VSDKLSITSTADYPLTAAQQRSHRLALRLLIPLMILLAVIVVPLYVLYDSARVSGPSMVPTLEDGEYLLITRGWSRPARGDVVVVTITDPGGTTEELVKRVVALPGDTVFVQGDTVQVNGAPEGFRHETVVSAATDPAFTIIVPPGRVFAMGDNRPVSDDSRDLGPLAIADVHGAVVAVWWPITRVRPIAAP
jgi:signal peptidase I